jgi:hypothetical protein
MVTLKNTGLFWKQQKTQNTTPTDTATTKMRVDRCLIIFIFQHMKYGDIQEHWPKELPQYLFFPVVIFSGRNLIDKEICQKTELIIFIFQNMKYGDTREHWIVFEAAQNTKHNTHRHNNHKDEPCHPTYNFHFLFLVMCE